MIVAVVGAGVGGVEQVVVICQIYLTAGAPVAGFILEGIVVGRGDQIGGLRAGIVVEDDVGGGGRNGCLVQVTLHQGHLGAGPAGGNGGRAAIMPAVDIGSGPVGGVAEVDGPGRSSAADGTLGAGLVTHISVAAVAVAIETVAGVAAGLGGGIVHNSHTGIAHGAVNAAAIDGELVAGKLIVVGAVGHCIHRQVDVTAAIVEVDDHHTGVTALVVVQVGAGILGQVLGLADEVVVEQVHRFGEVAGPAQLHHLTHLLNDRLGIGVVLIQRQVGDVQTAGEVQSHGVSAGGNQRPGLVQVVLIGPQGAAVAHSIVGLCPQNQLVCIGGLEVSLTQSGGAVTLQLVANVIGPDGLGDAHILGVGAHGQSALTAVALVGVFQQLAVEVQVDASGGLGIAVGAVDHRGPEVTGVAVVIIGGLDLLGGIKAEAVHTAVDILLHQSQRLVLYLLIGGVQVGQTGHALLGHIVAIHIAGGILRIIMPAGRIVQKIRIHQRAKLICAVVGGVVEHHVHDDLDVVLVCFVAQVDQLGLGADTVALGIVDVEADRLIHGPPVVIGSVHGAFLQLLHGRQLDGGITHIGDQAQIGFHIGNRPVPTVKR